MNSHQRLKQAFALAPPDRPPILGGWLAAPEHIQALTGCSAQAYWEDPYHWGLEAERALGSDGVITVFVPVSRGGYRCVDGRVLAQRAAYDVERVLAEIAALPEPEQVEAEFDEEAAYQAFVAEHRRRQQQCGELLWCPADWELIPHALWVHEFGYETALVTLAQHRDQYRKLIQLSAVRGRQRATLRARAIREGIHPPAILTGEDLCSQRGPMVSPRFLREEYYPLLEYTLEPLHQVNARVVWHCDGDVRLLLDDLFSCGIAGLQGFQRECGMALEWIVNLRTRQGDPLLILGPMSVTTTLPYGSPHQVRAEVQRSMETCRDKASLVFFTSNTITPDIPLDNVKAFWQAVRESRW